MKQITVVLFLLFSVPSYGQVEYELTYQPWFIPLEFSWGRDGLKVSASPSVITPIGRFGVRATAELYRQRNSNRGLLIKTNQGIRRIENNDLLLIVRTEDTDHYYKLKDGKKMKFNISGDATLEFSDNVLLLEFGESTEYSLEYNYKKENEVPRKEILEFTSKPAGAEVYMNGFYVGRTPVSAETSEHQEIEFRSTDTRYDNYFTTYVFGVDSKSIHASLEAIKPQLKLNTSPVAKIDLNGKYLGDTPKLMDITQNKNRVKLRAKGYRTFSFSYSPISKGKVDKYVEMRRDVFISAGAFFSSEELLGGQFAIHGIKYMPNFLFGAVISKNFAQDRDDINSLDPIVRWELDLTDTQDEYSYKENFFLIKVGYMVIPQRLHIVGGIGEKKAERRTIFQVSNSTSLSDGLGISENELVSFEWDEEFDDFSTIDINTIGSIGAYVEVGPVHFTVDYVFGLNTSQALQAGVLINPWGFNPPYKKL